MKYTEADPNKPRPDGAEVEQPQTQSNGFCMLLGEPCYKECPHHYYRESNGCWKK